MSDLRETVANAIKDNIELVLGRGYMGVDTIEGFDDAADAAIAAARPIIRAELFDELIAEAEDKENLSCRGLVYRTPQAMVVSSLADWLRDGKESNYE